MKRIGTFFLVALVTIITVKANAQFALDEVSQKQMVMTNLSSMPMAFTENRGQWNEKALFKADAGGATFWFCRDEVVYVFTRDTAELIEDNFNLANDLLGDLNPPRHKKEAMIIKARFVDADPNPVIIGGDRLTHNCNYFYGKDPSKWRTDVPNYSAITYKDIWPGIDLKYHGNGNGMKYDFIVNPGADISQIKIRYEGVDNLVISNAGDLEAQTRFGLVYENIPEIYQEINGAKVSVSGRYRMIEPGVFGFDLAQVYNPTYALIVDPEIVYSTYLGGSGNDSASDINIDNYGNVVVTGSTNSYDFPIFNPFDSTAMSIDIFLSKFSSSGDALLYSTFIGGSGYDYGRGLAIDNNNDFVIAGYTGSTDFPIINAIDSVYSGGGCDGFIFKLSAAGNSLIFSTYWGGSGFDDAKAIVADNQNNICVVQLTSSSDLTLVNPYDSELDGMVDIYLAKLNADGSSILYSTYLGGSDNDIPRSIAINSAGNILITGETYSTNFPTVNPVFPTNAGYADIFISEINPSSGGGNSLVFSTYFGGTDGEIAYSITTDENDNIYIAGLTLSTDIPMVGAYDASHNGDETYDIIVAQFSAGSHSLLYSTYLGGSQNDIAKDICVNGDGKIFIAGETRSPDFPAIYPIMEYIGGTDILLANLSSTGQCLEFSTFLGGTSDDRANALVLDDFNNIYIAGETSSPDFSILNPYDGSHNGGVDAFVAKVEIDNPGPILSNISGIITDIDLNPINNANVALTLTEYSDDTNINGEYSIIDICPGTYDIFISHPHFCDTLITDVNVDYNATVILDIILTRSGFIMGMVTDSMLSPIPGVYVSVENLGISDTTDVSGGYYLDNLYSGSYDVSFYHHDYADTTLDGISVTSGDTTIANMAMGQRFYAYLPGDVNMSTGNWPPRAWGNDINWLVAYYGGMLPYYEPPCRFDNFFAAADINGDCNLWGGPDINYYCNYLFGYEGYSISYCDDYLPAWPTEEDLPETAPSGWPNCDPSLTANHNPDPPVADPQDPDIEIWIGNVDGSPIEAIVGQRVNVDVYIQTTPEVKGANLHIPLAGDNQYIDSLLSQNEGQVFDDLSSWDKAIFLAPYSLPPNVDGWTSQSFMGFDDIQAPYLGLYLNAGSPTKMLSFVVKTANDSSLIGQTLDCLDIGVHPSGWPLFSGDSTGLSDIGYSVSVNISLIHFIEPRPGYAYLPGDVNMSGGTWPAAATGPDVTYLVNYFRSMPTSLACPLDGFWCSADANGDCNVIGSDVTKLVNVFRGIGSVDYCPDYPPAWPPIPEIMPPGWPNCETIVSRTVPPIGASSK